LVDRFRAITYVLRQEASVSLGLAGRKLRLAIERLARFDAQGGEPLSSRRRELVQNAAYLLSAYVIQREALGLRDDGAITEEFGLTSEIWNAVGIADIPGGSVSSRS
jgi:hypothetical protein